MFCCLLYELLMPCKLHTWYDIFLLVGNHASKEQQKRQNSINTESGRDTKG